jgi:hypothetical protein
MSRVAFENNETTRYCQRQHTPFGSTVRTLHHGRSFGADALVDRLGEAFAMPLHDRQQFFHVGRGKDA